MKVLMPVDGSQRSMATLQWAVNMLNKQSTRYYLLHVLETSTDMRPEVEQFEEALHLLKEARELILDMGAVVVKTTYVTGDPGPAICRYAEEISADQILIGTHGHTGIEGSPLGAVSQSVLVNCRRQVFVYRNLAMGGKPARGRRRIEPSLHEFPQE